MGGGQLPLVEGRFFNVECMLLLLSCFDRFDDPFQGPLLVIVTQAFEEAFVAVYLTVNISGVPFCVGGILPDMDLFAAEQHLAVQTPGADLLAVHVEDAAIVPEGEVEADAGSGLPDDPVADRPEELLGEHEAFFHYLRLQEELGLDGPPGDGVLDEFLLGDHINSVSISWQKTFLPTEEYPPPIPQR